MGSPMLGFDPMPYSAAAAGRVPGWRLAVASAMNAVLHDSVNAPARLATGASPSALWNDSPSTVTVGGQVAGDAGDSPCWMRAVDVIILNVEPGGNSPSNPWSNAYDSGTLSSANTCPVDARTATRAP